MKNLRYIQLLSLALVAGTVNAQTGGDGTGETYRCDFSSSEQFTNEWSVTNRNGDLIQWEFIDWQNGPDGNPGCAYCQTNQTTGNDDFMTTMPLALQAGTNHVTFYAKGVRDDGTETLELLIGTTADVNEMSTIKQWTINSKTWKQKAVNFEIEQSGTYYLSLRSTSTNGFSTYVDDFSAGVGATKLTPELSIEKIVRPYSQCDYSETTAIGAVIRNTGNGDAQQITLAYTINGGSPVSETTDKTIAPDSSATFIFKTQADMSADGTYSIKVTAACDDITAERSETVEHKPLYSQLPLQSDFTQGPGDDWEGHSTGSWTYDAYGQCYTSTAQGTENGLYSPCISIDTPVRLTIAYSGGMFSNTASMKVILGLAGTDIAQWRTVFEDNAVTRNGAEKEIEIADIEPGMYTVAIINTSTGTDIPLNIYHIGVNGMYEHDLKAIEQHTALAVQTPTEQYNSSGTYAMTVVNRGTEAVKRANVSMLVDGQTLFSSWQDVNIQPGDTAVVAAQGTMPKTDAGQTVKGISMLVGTDGEKYDADNSIRLPDILLTDSILATENIKEFTHGIGISYDTAKFGNVYRLNAADTLTSVTIGLAEDKAYIERDMEISLYTLEEDGRTIGRRLFQTVAERGAEGGLRTFSFTPKLLLPGNYYIEVHQMTQDNMGVANIPDDEMAMFYQSDGSRLYPISGSGAIVARLNFGHNATVYKKNIELTGFTAPLKDKGLYGKNDSIGVELANLGTETVTQMKLACTVDGVELADTLIDILPYGTAEIMFRNIDLTSPGIHEIAVTAILDGDEDTSDNTITRTIEAVEEANPYRMDFEQCDDFDCGTMFNPRWRTVDRLGRRTDSWARYDYPHYAEPVGFIAFNPESTTPPITDIPGFYPHSGKRFGAAFATGFGTEEIESDVWLISPKLKLGNGSRLTLFVKTYAIEYRNKPERFRLLVSDTDDAFDSFIAIGGEREAPAEEWEEVSVDLSQYDGKDVYVALQYISKNTEGTVMMVDDIEITTQTAGITEADTGGQDINIYATEGGISINAGQEIVKVEVYSASGMAVYSAGGTSTCSHCVPTSGLPAGVYIVKAMTAGGGKTVKIKL